MAKKPDITTIASGYYSRQALNNNFENLQDGFDNTLSLDGSTPNAMGADLDLNGNDILNAGVVNTDALKIDGTLVSVGDLSAAGATLSSISHTGDGSTVAFSTGYQAFITDNTQVYIDGVYQNKAGYSISGTTLTFSEAPPLNAAIEIVVARTLDFGADDAANVNYNQGGTGSVNRTVLTKLQEFVSVKDFGAVGDGVTDDYQSFIDICTATNEILVPEGDYAIGTARIGEFQKPLNVVGTGPDSIIRVMSGNADDTAFRVGAVGGSYYRTRAVTKFENLVFMTESGITAPWAYTGIDVQSTYPIVMKDIVALSMGPDSIKCSYNFYGYINGLNLVNSGLTLFEANVIEISGGDIRAEQSAVDPSGGALLFGNEGRYPVEMEDSDLVKFTGTVFEGWKCPVIKIVRSDDTIFNGCWFEGLESTSHVVLSQQAGVTEFNSCQLDFAFPYTDTFIHVDNSGPDADRRVNQTTNFRINGGNLLLESTGYGSREEFITTANSEPVSVLIDGLTFRGGSLFADPSVEFDVRSINLVRTAQKFFYTRPNADFLGSYNKWMPNSVSADYDFTTANIAQIGGAGLTVATTTTDGEFMTGTKGVKVSGITSGATVWEFGRTTTSEMGAVTSEGETYFVMARVKADQELTVRLQINGGYADFGVSKDVKIPANKWTDLVLQTQEDTTWAQGRFFAPTVKFEVVNGSGSTANFFIDRLDYQIVDGDIHI